MSVIRDPAPVLREAVPADAQQMADVQNAIHQAGLRAHPVDVALVRERYLDRPGRIACTVAELDGVIAGFQSLVLALPDNEYDLPAGWGIIGTHIDPRAGRSGLGRALFSHSLAATRGAGLRHVDAAIGQDNAPALAYYQAMGFRPYRQRENVLHHRLDLDDPDR